MILGRSLTNVTSMFLVTVLLNPAASKMVSVTATVPFCS